MKKWLILLLAFLLIGCEEIPANGVTQTTGTTDQIPVELVEITDGDTIKIKYNGNIEKVRYLLIDTPETNHKTLGKQPFGDDAKVRNKELLNSGDLTIEFDVGNRVDDYGRMLAYIYVDGVSVQETLLAEGLARVAYVFPPNTRYLDNFEAASEVAKVAKIGVWETEDYVTSRGFDASTIISNKTNDDVDKKCAIKGNINQKGNKIYHMPGGKDYDNTNPEQWFCTEQEALEAGFKKAGA
ncbi:thermonuclease family protein [Psychrobacillus sp.]|uniref:thermonuclease family protein n=1 Tax=Psychrobacillus sp. TaxID=1871623 RepID=UPI0028BDF387|nr:thermonuclease family protein [Psychrobacillus sp.]